MQQVVAIINPIAGKGRGARSRARAIEELRRLFRGVIFHESRHPGHATALARDAAGADLVIALGGDGTVREVAAGLLGGGAALAVVPTGSGNDFRRSLGIPANVRDACRIARDGIVTAVDAVRVTVGHPDASRELLCVNVAGFGFDARIVAEAERFKRLRGMPLYLAALVRAIARYRCPLVRIEADGFTGEQRILLVAAANGRFFGGGMNIAPGAELDDGFFDGCIIDAVRPWTILRYVPSLIRGTHTRLRGVRMVRTRSLEIEARESLSMELDGDLVSLGDARCVRLEILPRALRVKTDTVALPPGAAQKGW
jgi:diacylglycerol kinase (ATP)